jgi:hypothetical protein
VRSCCFAGGSTSTDASCWPWMGRESRRSTTRIATSREPRCKSSSARPTSGWTTICGGSTRGMSRKAGRAAARARKTEPARAILDVENINVVADRGYFKIEDIEACEKAGMTPHVPKPQRGSSVRKGFFRKDEFRYDPDQDVYICPAGETLSPNHEGKSRDLKKIDYSNPAACPACPLRSPWTTDHRRSSPGDILERSLVRGPVGGEALPARQVGRGLLTCLSARWFRHL